MSTEHNLSIGEGKPSSNMDEELFKIIKNTLDDLDNKEINDIIKLIRSVGVTKLTHVRHLIESDLTEILNKIQARLLIESFKGIMSTEHNIGIGEGKPSSKVLKPPGGGSSDIFGFGYSTPQEKDLRIPNSDDDASSSSMSGYSDDEDQDVHLAERTAKKKVGKRKRRISLEERVMNLWRKAMKSFIIDIHPMMHRIFEKKICGAVCNSTLDFCEKPYEKKCPHDESVRTRVREIYTVLYKEFKRFVKTGLTWEEGIKKKELSQEYIDLSQEIQKVSKNQAST